MRAYHILRTPGYDLFCSGHSFLADGSLFVAGGHISNIVGLAKASIYNPFMNTWMQLARHERRPLVSDRHSPA